MPRAAASGARPRRHGARGRLPRQGLNLPGKRDGKKVAERKSFLLRLDPKIHDQLKRWADDELRSLNAQIDFVLRRALREAGRDREERDES